MKSNILSNFSHELRTPLHSILGFSAILAEETSEKELKEYARSIQRSGQRLLSTVTSIVELAALESTSRERVLYPVVLHDLVQEEAMRYKESIEERGLMLDLVLSARDLIVLLDKDRFHKAFEKLINNAIKFTHSGSIRIELTQELPTEAAVAPPVDYFGSGSANPARPGARGLAVISIRDSGIGMSPEFLEKAFDKFKQESSGFSRRYEGSGLGLPLARSYIRLMNGDVTLQSEPGQGTEVLITLPVVAQLRADE